MKYFTLIILLTFFCSCTNDAANPNEEIIKTSRTSNNEHALLNKFNLILKNDYPNFSIKNHSIGISDYIKDSLYISSIYTINKNNQTDGPNVEFYKNGNIKTISFIEKDTVVGWIEWYDSTGKIEEKQFPYPPPLYDEKKMKYFERFNNDSIIKCWSARFEPSNSIFETKNDTFNLAINMCCNNCISYELVVETINQNDTVYNKSQFIRPDTNLSFKKLKFGENKIKIELKGLKSDSSNYIAYHNITVNKKN